MDFAFTDEQNELRYQARRWLSDTYPLSRNWDRQEDRWSELSALGWLGASIAEHEGGAGLGFVEEAVLFEELGYALYPGPYLATVGFALPCLGSAERREVAAGRQRWSMEVDGLVPSLASVDFVVGNDGRCYAARGEEQPSVDPTRPVGLLARGRSSPLSGVANLPRARVAMACEAIGIAQRALDLGVEHAKSREQFGKPIGVYQAISHSLANTYTDVELARSLTYWAVCSVATGSPESAIAAPAAKAFATDVAVGACERSIQVHGGLGFTWEYPLHWFYKRALWLQAFGGFPSELRAEVADALIAGDDPAVPAEPPRLSQVSAAIVPRVQG